MPVLLRRVSLSVAAAIVAASLSALPVTAAAAAEPPAAPPAPAAAPTAAPASVTAGPELPVTPLSELPPQSEGVPMPLPDAPREPGTAAARGDGSAVLTTTDDPAWPVVAENDGLIVRFGSSPAALVDIAMPEGHAILSARTPMRAVAPRIDRDGVVYEGVATDTDLRFDVGPSGVTQRLVVKSARGISDVTMFLADPDGALNGLTSKGGGGYELGSGEDIPLTVTPAYAYEHDPAAHGFMSEPGSAHQTVTAQDGGYVVRSWVDESWLDEHDYPIELDPNYSVVTAGTASGGRFNAMPQTRVLDTRNNNGGTTQKIAANGFYTVEIAGRGDIPQTGVGAAVLKIYPIAPTVSGKIAIYPAGATTNISAQVTFEANQTISNTAIVKLGTNGSVTVYNRSSQPLDVVMDMSGWFSSVDDEFEGGMIKLVDPARIMDTRSSTGPTSGAKLGAASTINVRINGEGGLPSSASEWSSVILNVHALTPSAESHLTVWPTGAVQPYSSMNFDSTQATLLTTKTSATGVISIYNSAGTVDVAIDVIGYYTPPDSTGFSPYTALNPSRIVDTRSALGTSRTTAIPSGTAVPFTVFGRGGIPTSGVSAVALNVVTVDPSAAGYVNVYNGDLPEPSGTATIRTATGENRQSLVIVEPSATGTVTVEPHNTSTHILIEVAGWFAVPRYAPKVTVSIVEQPTSGTFSTGEKLTVRMSVQNVDPSVAVTTDARFTPPELFSPTAGGVKVAGALCAAPVTCAFADATVSVLGVPQAATQTKTIDIPVVAGAAKGCDVVPLVASSFRAVAVYPDGSQYVSSPANGLSVTVCDNGLGMEKWWSYSGVSTGPQGSGAVNVANGNLVVQQVDATPVQAHGDLAFVFRRTYNSQDRSHVLSTGTLASGWTWNFGEVGGPAAPSGLYVPSLTGTLSPLAVTLIDRDGTRHVFKPRALTALIAAPTTTKPVALTGTKSALSPQTNLLPAGYTHLCIDQAYTAPAGVHTSLWRYIAVNSTSTDPCTGASAPTGAVVAGYAAMRTDRLRTEYDMTGRLRSLVDAAGNELQYSYESVPNQPVDKITVTEARVGSAARTATLVPGSADTSCGFAERELTLTDPAKRVTRYCLNDVVTTRYLTRVVNPDGTTIDYDYKGVGTATSETAASCTGAATGQLCRATDPRQHAVTFTYASAGTTGASPVVASVTDRRGKKTTFTYEFGGAWPYTSVDRDDREGSVVRSQQRVRYSLIDTSGRVLRVDEGTPGADASLINSLRQTDYTWDSQSAGCRTAGSGVDNLLCSTVRKTVATHTRYNTIHMPAIPDAKTEYLYNLEGHLVRSRKHTYPGETRDVVIDATTGYRTQYVATDGVVTCYDDKIGGAGNVTSAAAACTGAANAGSRARDDSATIFVISDRVESLTPNGNAATEWDDYLTTYVVDNTSTVPPNARPAAAEEARCLNGAATGNSGLVCRVKTPSPVAVGQHVSTDYWYDEFGQRTYERRPAQQPTGNRFQYKYQADSEKDLSDSVTAGGWLRGIQAPDDEFVAFGYDAAGNVVRTWDRNATAANKTGNTKIPLGNYPGTTGSPTSDRYVEEVPKQLDTTKKHSSPWRGIVERRDQLGKKTTYTLDVNGNTVKLTPPRGQASTTSAAENSTEWVYDYDDRIEEEKVPQTSYQSTRPVTTIVYDDYGNPATVTDAAGGVTSLVYDAVNRRTASYVSRGAATDTTLKEQSKGCYDSTTFTVLPRGMATGQVVCSESVSYFDGHDQPHYVVGPGGFEEMHSFDGAGRPVDDNITRSGSAPSALSQHRYDRDGNELRYCDERSRERDAADNNNTAVYPDDPGPFECDGDNVFGTTRTYNAAGLLATETTKRQSSAREAALSLTTTYTYDANGNIDEVEDPLGRTRGFAYDVLDRVVCEEVPRAGSDVNRRITEYDAVGNVAKRSRFVDGNCATTTAPADKEFTTYTYDHVGRLVDTIVAPTSSGAGTDGGSDVKTRNVYNDDGQLVAVYEPRAFGTSTPNDAYATRWTFDEAGRPWKMMSPRSGDAASDAPEPAIKAPGSSTSDGTQTTDCPKGVTGFPAEVHVCTTEVRYDLAGNIEVEWLATAGSGRDTSTNAEHVKYEYYGDGFVSSVSKPPVGTGTERAKTLLYYDAAGRQTAAMGPRYKATDSVRKYLDIATTRYNGAGEVTQNTLPAAVAQTASAGATGTHTESFARYADGRVANHWKFDGLRDHYTWYSDGLLEAKRATSSRMRSDGSYVPIDGVSNGDMTTYAYDKAGNVTHVYSPAANAVDTTTEDAAQETKTATRYEYFEDNLLKTVRTPITADGTTANVAKFRERSYAYDDAGNQLSQVDKTITKTGTNSTTGEDVYTAANDATTLGFSYYDNGRLKTETGRTGGATITRTYTASGQVATIADSTNTAANITNTYYFDGRLRTSASGSRTTTFEYDGAGREVAREVLNGTTAAPGSTVSSYDSAGLLTSMSSAAATTANTTGSRASGTFTWVHDIAGRVTKETFPNGAVATLTWANDSTLTSRALVKSASDSTLVAKWEYTYEDFRKKTQVFSGLDGSTTRSGVTSTYEYTAGGRLKSFKDGSGATVYATWDHNGNRTCYGAGCPHPLAPTGGTGTKTKYAYRADNAIASEDVGSGAVAYPEPEEWGGLTGDRCTTYAYDAFDRLKSSTPASPAPSGCATGAATATYTYDGLDRQRSVTAGAVTTSFSYAGTGPHADRTTKASGTVDYALDPVGNALAVKDGTQTQFLADNGAGSVGSVVGTDANGVPTAACQARYTPFGTMVGSAGNGAATTCTATATSNDRYFAGARKDPVTDAYNFGSRTYDPSKGSFLTPDAYRDRGGATDVALGADPLTSNRYSYVNGDPVNLIDPDGHRPGCEEDSAGGGGSRYCPNTWSPLSWWETSDPDTKRTLQNLYCQGKDVGCHSKPYAAPSFERDRHLNLRIAVDRVMGDGKSRDEELLREVEKLIDVAGATGDGVEQAGRAAARQGAKNKFTSFAKSKGLSRGQLALLVVAAGIDAKQYAAEGAALDRAIARAAFVNGGAAVAGVATAWAVMGFCGLLGVPSGGLGTLACGAVAAGGAYYAGTRTHDALEDATAPRPQVPRNCNGVSTDPTLITTAGFRPRHCTADAPE